MMYCILRGVCVERQCPLSTLVARGLLGIPRMIAADFDAMSRYLYKVQA